MTSLHQAFAQQQAVVTPVPHISQFLIPRLVITKQNCLSQETAIRDGISRQVFVVVKHSPFTINLGLDTSQLTSMDQTRQVLNLSHVTLECRLFYDSEENKEVDFVKLKPMEHKIHVNESGTQAQVECRLKVLTSQLEDMLFRIQFRALDPATLHEISPLLQCQSEPIKVISKPEQSRKKKKSAKKRTLNDMLLETLSRIEQQQESQQDMLMRLSSELHTPGSLPQSASSTTSASASTSAPSSLASFLLEEQQRKKRKLFEDDRPLDFESSFRDLMDAFDMLSPDMKVEKMRRFVERSGTSSEYLSELHDLFCAEGLGQEIGREVMASASGSMPGSEGTGVVGECTCENCPHKLELERIEEFYKEVFSLG